MKKKLLGVVVLVLAFLGLALVNTKNTYADEDGWSIKIGAEYRKDTELSGYNNQQPEEKNYNIGTLSKNTNGKFSWKSNSSATVITGKLDGKKENLKKKSHNIPMLKHLHFDNILLYDH